MKEHFKNMNKPGVYYPESGFGVPVTVEDIRSVYGRIDYQIRAKYGNGVKWVQSDSVTVED